MLIRVIYKERFSYDEPNVIEFNRHEDFSRWYIRRYEDIKIIEVEEN